MIGHTLGHYHIVEKLGEGGMGVVYRARDGSLNRDIALKVLPEAFARDSERSARFQREAQILAALNHPNIAAIYGLEQQNDVRYLVLEYVPGETLADSVKRGALAIEEALEICTQIAQALEAAHEKGIIHRDLKPANVKVTPEGQVKVLDFGLAKAFQPEGSDADLSKSPTISAAATRAGVILGTPAYMPPEQARGKPVDKRADIWAFGCVLYEMLAGKPAFGANTITDTLAAIIRNEPDWSALPAGTTAAVHRLLRRCLQKDPRERLRDAGDALLELKQPAAAERAMPPATARPHAIPWLVAALFAAIALVLAMVHFRQAPPEQRVTKFALLPPEKTAFRAIAVSPDGRRVAFTATAAFGGTQLWVRPLDGLAAQPLAGTEGASYPFWSPDGRSIGFFAGSKLQKIEASGGPPQTLARALAGRGAAWSRDGVIVFARSDRGSLLQVPADGGEPKPVTQIDASRLETSHRWPQFLPAGRRFLHLTFSSQQPEHWGIYLGSLDSKEMDSKKTRLVATDSSATFAASATGPGYLLFLRERALMAQRFDPGKLELSGQAFPVAEPVGVEIGFGRARFSVSETGVLVYNSSGGGNRELVWMDRGGKRLETVGALGAYWQLDLSPDGRRVAAMRTDPQTGDSDIWLFDVVRAASSRFTFHPAVEGIPVWSPDGSRIAFYSTRDGPWNLYQKTTSGTGEDESLLKTQANKWPTDWSRDGRFLLFVELDAKTGADLWVLPLTAETKDAGRKPMPFLRTEFNEFNGRFSPDGKWVAYDSNESGRYEVYVREFLPGQPGSGGKWPVSTGGGVAPRWHGGGKELFYLAPDRKLMAVEVKAGSGFQAGRPRPLFQTSAFTGTPAGRYAVTADGQRFLINSEMEEAVGEPATVILNWTAALKK
jgi:Tol biopolymer transport system component